MKKVTEVAAKAAQKKPYSRPELTKHGKVESLTQIYSVGNSTPFNTSKHDK
jgi:hypothetical protein